MADNFVKTKIIELFGFPNTGKSTTARTLCKFLNNSGLKTKILVDKSSRCPVKDKLSPYFNYWTTFALYKEYIEACESEYDLLIADRGILDAEIWITLFSDYGNYKPQLIDFKALINNNFIKKSIFRAYFYHSSIDLILKREKTRTIRKNQGRIVNRKVLTDYYKTYQQIKDELKYAEIIEVDTSKYSINDMANFVKKDIFMALKMIVPPLKSGPMPKNIQSKNRQMRLEPGQNPVRMPFV
jgi:adenylate kinase family enzyme